MLRLHLRSKRDCHHLITFNATLLSSSIQLEVMRETEVKIIEINRHKIEQTLTALKAVKIFDAEITTIFLDFIDNRIQKGKNVLRLRKQPDKVELTYKKVETEQTVKIAEEYTVEVSSLDSIINIMQKIGLIITQKMQKHRVSYKIDNVRFDIDRYTGDYGFIPELLEIEGTPMEIKKYAELLGFQTKDCLAWSTDDLIRHYSNIEDSH